MKVLSQQTKDVVLQAFVPDGSLRDIYVFGTRVGDWVRVADTLLCSDLDVTLQVDGAETFDPTDLQRVFKEPDVGGVLVVNFPWGGINSHLFVESEIEFDIDPRNWNDDNLHELTNFMGLLGSTTARNVYLTAENTPEYAILAYRHPEAELVPPERPAARTKVGLGIAERVRPIISQLSAFDRTKGFPDALPIWPELLSDWKAIYDPNSYSWHSDLTVDEFRVLYELDTVFGFFVDGKSPQGIAGYIGVPVARLERQFWTAVERANTSI